MLANVMTNMAKARLSPDDISRQSVIGAQSVKRTISLYSSKRGANLLIINKWLIGSKLLVKTASAQPLSR